MSSLGKTFFDLQHLPILAPTNNWVQALSSYDCNKQLDLDLDFFESLTTFARLESTNWKQPPNPVSKADAWNDVAQSDLETVLQYMRQSNKTFNPDHVREQKVNENYLRIVQKVFAQRDDSIHLLHLINSYLYDLDAMLTNLLLLVSACQGSVGSAKTLSFENCAHILQKSTYSQYQVEQLSCTPAPEHISLSLRLHQTSKILGTSEFQKFVLISSAVSYFCQLITYSYLIIRCVIYFKKPKAHPSHSDGNRKLRPRREDRPLISTQKPPPYKSSAAVRA